MCPQGWRQITSSPLESPFSEVLSPLVLVASIAFYALIDTLKNMSGFSFCFNSILASNLLKSRSQISLTSWKGPRPCLSSGSVGHLGRYLERSQSLASGKKKKKKPLWAEKWGMSSNRTGQCVLVAGELARSRQASGDRGDGERILKTCHLGTHSTSI